MATTEIGCAFCSQKRCLVLDYEFSFNVDMYWFRNELEKLIASSHGLIISRWGIDASLRNPRRKYAILVLGQQPIGNPALSLIIPDGDDGSVIATAFWHWDDKLARAAIATGDAGAKNGRCCQDKGRVPGLVPTL